MQVVLIGLGALLFLVAIVVVTGMSGIPSAGPIADDGDGETPSPEDDAVDGDESDDGEATEGDADGDGTDATDEGDGDDGANEDDGNDADETGDDADETGDDTDETEGDADETEGDDADEDDADEDGDDGDDEEDGEDETAVYRVNVGGPSIPTDEGPDWSADTEDDPSPNLNAGDPVAAETPDEIVVEDDVPSHASEAMFQTYRWDRGGGEEMTYVFPVDADREYEVRIYVAETYFVEDESDARDIEEPYDEGEPRTFGVTIDGETVLESYEPFEEHGHDVGAVQRFDATADDGVITIRFDHEVEDPTVSGIEIVDTGPRDGGDDEDDDDE